MIVELKLEAISAVKLLPSIVVCDPELPGPVEVLDVFNIFYNLVRHLIVFSSLFVKLL